MSRYFAINQGQVIDEVIDGEAVMINIVTGTYYCTNVTGAQVWEQLKHGASLEQLTTTLCARYPVDAGVVAGDVDRLLDRLRSENLVTESDTPVNGRVARDAVVAATSPYSPPDVEIFTDLQDLLLLDPVHEVDPRGWPHAAG